MVVLKRSEPEAVLLELVRKLAYLGAVARIGQEPFTAFVRGALEPEPSLTQFKAHANNLFSKDLTAKIRRSFNENHYRDVVFEGLGQLPEPTLDFPVELGSGFDELQKTTLKDILKSKQ